jgi:hypothetical protein
MSRRIIFVNTSLTEEASTALKDIKIDLTTRRLRSVSLSEVVLAALEIATRDMTALEAAVAARREQSTD